MKTTISSFTSIAILSILFMACAQPRIASNDRYIESFSAVESDVTANIIYRQSSNTGVKIFGDKSTVEAFSMKVKNGVLCINCKESVNERGVPKVDIYVFSPQLNRIELSGAGIFTLDGPITGNKLFIESEGMENLVGDNLSYEHIIVESNGTGNVTLSGKTNSLQIISDGVGNVRTENLQSVTVLSTSNGAGNVYCAASGGIDLTVNGEGNIFYSGNPTMKNIVRNGMGKITRTSNLTGL